ncbi:uncharacterized protein VICG_01522 [Vittaforma corneae ATCC 50505]|uniref:Uncharacterized protein n=1 Tax=Vittaforma corneae (strain ATCC 50505) TaxID=993615 RepID=L2GM87_VITCO|nr:uncharacterized protein VICG_01522 [Vittaforma corneae ATCC 50505]ELA41417.1 hypothetical protein VICG_01522 [Vittaforma corneae ATCC 50505]
MINTIGFLPNSTEIRQLNEFVPNESVKEHLEYLQIPILPRKDVDSSDKLSEERPVIKSTDSILFCTSNTEEISTVAFYGYDDTEIFVHHDMFVFSTIIDSCFIKNTLIGVATFEPAIMIYDFMVDFPVLPQYLLIGHTGPVTGIKNKFEKLMSCSEDKMIIEWDINEMRLRSQKNHDVSIERFDFEGNNLVFGSQKYLNINNENISLDYDIEQLKIRDNLVFVSDCEGYIQIYDVRMPGKAMISQRLHESALVDFCLAKDWIVTTSQDCTVKSWKTKELALRYISEINTPGSQVLSLGYNEYNNLDEVFAGDENDNVFPIKLEENAQNELD